MAKQDHDDEGVPDFSAPVGPARVVTLDQTNGYGDPELAAYEQLEELEYDEPAGADAGDAALAALEERTERLAEQLRAQHAGKVHRKLQAGVGGAAILGGLPALLQSLDVTGLPESVQPFVVLAAALIGLFVSGYLTPEREAPEV